MSTNSELKARLAHLGPVRVASPPRLSSDQAVGLLLRRTGPLDKPVTIVRRLMEAQSSMRAANDAVARLAERGSAVCTVSRDADLDRLAHDLAGMHVQVRRRRLDQTLCTSIADMRAHHGLSQREYADLLGLDVRTLQNWEQGRNRPDPAAISLMRVFAHAPDVVEDALSEPVP